VNRLTDVDRDGYGLLGRPGDPALFDARVHPYAIDVPGDGIDQDGVAGDLPAALGRYEEPTARRSTGRAVAMWCSWCSKAFVPTPWARRWGARPVTPVLDGLARGGLSIAHAYSHNGYTVQARNHIFTGSIAGVRGGTTIVDDFKANGYETAYFSGQDDSFGARPTAPRSHTPTWRSTPGRRRPSATRRSPPRAAWPCPTRSC
jgi:hypothetical protein